VYSLKLTRFTSSKPFSLALFMIECEKGLLNSSGTTDMISIFMATQSRDYSLAVKNVYKNNLIYN